MLGQPASWHTVCRPSRCTSPRSAVNCGPIVAFTLIHGGLRSIGVSALRASMRSMRRPSGWTRVTLRAYAVAGRNPLPPAGGRRGSRPETGAPVSRPLAPSAVLPPSARFAALFASSSLVAALLSPAGAAPLPLAPSVVLPPSARFAALFASSSLVAALLSPDGAAPLPLAPSAGSLDGE